MTTTEPTPVPADANADERLIWIGEDDRGIELEIVALVLPGAAIVIHVMASAQEAAMTTRPRCALSPTVGRSEELRDREGRVIDDEYVNRAVEGAVAYVRGRGRPSLSDQRIRRAAI